MVAAWVSDETATGFNVNLALSKWTAERAASFTGYTVQFEHQGVQFGVAAFFDGEGWDYSNAFIDVETGEMEGFEDSTGSFTPGTPALLTVLFEKRHFPHGDSADNKLVGFKAATADFKTSLPWGIAPVPGAPPNGGYTVCDLAQGDGAYAFQVGGHSAHGGGAAPSDANQTAGAAPAGGAGTAGSDDPAPVSPAAAPVGGKNETPAAGAPALVALACAAALALRRRRA